MNKKLNKILLIAIMSLIILLIIICIFVGISRMSKFKEYGKYAISIIVEATKKESADREITTIDVKDDGKIAQINTSFMMNPIYVTENRTMYESSGRFKGVKSDYSYRDIYSTLTKIEIEKDDGNYHPEVSREVINELLKSLFIDYEINKGAVGNMTIKAKKIEEFSIYLRDFYGYDKLGIIITFEEIDDDYKVAAPIFYDEVIDDVDERELRFIN